MSDLLRLKGESRWHLGNVSPDGIVLTKCGYRGALLERYDRSKALAVALCVTCLRDVRKKGAAK